MNLQVELVNNKGLTRFLTKRPDITEPARRPVDGGDFCSKGPSTKKPSDGYDPWAWSPENEGLSCAQLPHCWPSPTSVSRILIPSFVKVSDRTRAPNKNSDQRKPFD